MSTTDATPEDTPWKVRFSSYARKQKGKLPAKIQARLLVLVAELSLEGPIQPEWTHFGRLAGSRKKEVYHCHLNGGRPVYVVIWEVKDREAQVVKIVYDGTHERADYSHYSR